MSLSQTQTQNTFFQINDYLTLRLERGVTNIFINGVLFNQCKFLLFNINGSTPEKYDNIESIDEAETALNRRMESTDRGGIDPYTEFWGHCSNLQAWYENDYNTCILHRNLAFPLLQALTKAGDPVAKKVFKEEIVTRFLSGFMPVMEFLLEQGFLDYLGNGELEVLFDQLDFSTIFSQKGFLKSRFFDKIIRYIRTNTTFLNDIFKQCLQKSLTATKEIIDFLEIRNLPLLRVCIKEIIEEFDNGQLSHDSMEIIEDLLSTRLFPHLNNKDRLALLGDDKLLLMVSALLEEDIKSFKQFEMIFNILTNLLKSGNPEVKKVLKKGVTKGFESGISAIIMYLWEEGYFFYI